MGIFDKLRRKKKSKLDEPRFPSATQYAPPPAYTEPAPMPTRTAPIAMPAMPPLPRAPAVPLSATSGSLKAELDLVLSQMENLRMQYESITSQLQNIQRLVSEIRSFCK